MLEAEKSLKRVMGGKKDGVASEGVVIEGDRPFTAFE